MTSIFTDPRELPQYREVKVGDTLPFKDKSGFGPHWNSYLNDTFVINRIYLCPAALDGPPPDVWKPGMIPLPRLVPAPKVDIVTKRYDTSGVPPRYIQVMVSSVEHPQWENKPIGIESFLEE